MCCNFFWTKRPTFNHFFLRHLALTPRLFGHLFGAFSQGVKLKIPGKHPRCQVHNWAQAVSSAEASGASAVVVFNDLDAQAVMVGWFGQVATGR